MWGGMRARTEALVGVVSLALLATVAAALGGRENRGEAADSRASSYVAGPYGTRGLADALTRLGVNVRRHRTGARRLPDTEDSLRTALVLADPMMPPSPEDVTRFVAWAGERPGRGLVLAGRGADGVLKCYGLAVDWRGADSVAVAGTGVWPAVEAVLASHAEVVLTDSSRLEDAGTARCVVPAVARADTLLETRSGRVVALRLWLADGARSVLALADAGLLRNRALRETAAGPFALGLFVGRYDRVVFEETSQGFGAGGSLGDAVLAWSWRSPLGWAAWQLAGVGLLVLLAGAIRFGPVRRLGGRRRRSSLEHVRALATALAAARGHDVAIQAMLRGLRRRLNPAARVRGDAGPWLRQLQEHARSPRAQAETQTLQALTRPGQDADGVLRAATAVEDLWEELRP